MTWFGVNDDTTVRELSLGELVDGKYQIVRLESSGLYCDTSIIRFASG